MYVWTCASQMLITPESLITECLHKISDIYGYSNDPTTGNRERTWLFVT